MQQSPQTDKSVKREAMCKAHIYKWGCICCGPKDRKEHVLIHQTERSIRNREEWEDVQEDQDEAGV